MPDNDLRHQSRGRGAVLTVQAYRTLVSVSFIGWGGLLILFFYSHTGDFYLKRDDLLALVQTAAALAAVVLAIVAFLHETGTENHYLKLALAALTLVFVLCTMTGLLAAFLQIHGEPNLKPIRFRFLLVGWLYVAFGAWGLILVRSLMGTPLRRLRPLVYSLHDHSLFILPVFAFTFWSDQLSFAAITVVLCLQGLLLLFLTIVVLTIVVWSHRDHKEDLLNQVLDVFRERCSANANRTAQPQVVSLDYLRNRLLSNDETLLEVINQLQARDRVLGVGHRLYYMPDAQDWEAVCRALKAADFIIIDKSSDMLDSSAAERLAEVTRLPKEYVSQYFLKRAAEFVRLNFNDFREYNHNDVYANRESLTKIAALFGASGIWV